MHANLRTTLAAAVLVAAVPAVGIASAHEGNGGGEHSGPKQAKRCERGGKGYEAQGLLADGSTLSQVAGADTARKNDDRFSGTVIVQVRQGNRRGRQDKGLTSFALTNVRALGTVAGDAPLPPVGARVLLVGKLGTPCPAPTTPAPTTATPTPSPSPEPTASQLRHDDAVAPTTPPASDYPSGSDYPTSTTPAATTPTLSAAVIRLVVFKTPKGQAPVRGEDPGDQSDDQSDDDGGRQPRGPKPPCAKPSILSTTPQATTPVACPVPSPEPADDPADDEGDDDGQDDAPVPAGPPHGPRR